MAEEKKTAETESRVLLVGNPNVGKSVLFTHLTGVRALSSNYPGTTVGFLEGTLRHGGHIWHLVDVPGAYTLDATNEAEEVARQMVEKAATQPNSLAIIVVDATALERNLFLTLQVMSRGLPCIIALNMVDEARHLGIDVNVQKLQQLLGVPVIPTVAVTEQGISDLVAALPNACSVNGLPTESGARWMKIGEIVQVVQKVIHRHHTLMDRFEDFSVNSLWGCLLGVAVLALTFWLVQVFGGGLRDYVLDPLYRWLMMPVLNGLSKLLGPGLLHNLVVGTLINGGIDPEQSFGLLSTGLYVAFVMVFPYVLVFYALLCFLEDLGYLPRMAVVFDSLMHRMGLHGYAIIPTLLSFGCNVPGVMATRVLESMRERFIAATLISVAVPCAGLQAMIIGTVGPLGWKYLLLVYATLFFSWIFVGLILNKFLTGYSPELITEIPPYRLPPFKDWYMKLWIRMKSFFAEAIPLVMIGIIIINLLEFLGIMKGLARLMAPVFNNILGLPSAAAPAVLIGLLRKDVAMGMLIPLALNAKQMTIAAVVLSMTFPCFATFAVLTRELGVKRMFGSLAISLSLALIAGGILNFVL